MLVKMNNVSLAKLLTEQRNGHVDIEQAQYLLEEISKLEKLNK